MQLCDSMRPGVMTQCMSEWSVETVEWMWSLQHMLERWVIFLWRVFSVASTELGGVPHDTWRPSQVISLFQKPQWGTWNINERTSDNEISQWLDTAINIKCKCIQYSYSSVDFACFFFFFVVFFFFGMHLHLILAFFLISFHLCVSNPVLER